MRCEDKPEMATELKNVIGLLNSTIFHTDTIKETNDPEIIETSILCIEDARSKMPASWKRPKGTVKEDIRNGFGDFKAIQEKCIALGIV